MKQPWKEGGFIETGMEVSLRYRRPVDLPFNAAKQVSVLEAEVVNRTLANILPMYVQTLFSF